jgi:hypothetical protein
MVRIAKIMVRAAPLESGRFCRRRIDIGQNDPDPGRAVIKGNPEGGKPMPQEFQGVFDRCSGNRTVEELPWSYD